MRIREKESFYYLSNFTKITPLAIDPWIHGEMEVFKLLGLQSMEDLREEEKGEEEEEEEGDERNEGNENNVKDSGPSFGRHL